MSNGSTGRILVVDDNQDAANATAMLIAEMGGDARVAYDGESALAMLQEYQPEVILLDIGMRGLDGYETCQRIRGVLGNGVLLVALTGFGQEQDKEKATRAGFDAHLTKPAGRGGLDGDPGASCCQRGRRGTTVELRRSRGTKRLSTASHPLAVVLG